MPDVIATLPLTSIEAAQSCPLGTVTYDENGYEYMYVKFLDAVTYAAGQVLTWASATAFHVTNDRSGGSSISNRPAGICLAVATQNSFGWILRRGRYSAVVTNGDDDIAVGDALIVATGTDGACDSAAAATTTVHTLSFGHALAVDVDAANTVNADVNCYAR